MNKSQLNKAIEKEVERLDKKRSGGVSGAYFPEAEKVEGSIPSQTIKKFTNPNELLEYLRNHAKKNETIVLDEAGVYTVKGMSSCAVRIQPYEKDGRIKLGRAI